ncbi:MAG TPA: hypothetical protein VGO57_18695 [Verrucomicrobiae bacterium]|jgi:hypothetical protein
MKLIGKCLAVLFMSLVFWLCWVWHRTGVLEQAFARVQRDDSQMQVVELFGQPTFITSELQTDISWDENFSSAKNGIRCVRQFHYCPPFSICGESWIIGFDDRSNAVAKCHIVSP